MTTISTGGGPTLEQRRAFAGLKDGAEVPGYRGYIPQIKYHVGNTYGNSTHALSQEYGMKRAMTILGPCEPERICNKLPATDGNKKFTEKMVPGYTGYVPHLMFRYGGTYRQDCDYSIDNFISARDGYAAKQEELARHSRANPRLTAISYDPDVRDKLNRYRDTHPTPATLVADKRTMQEPPIPGYQGYIPRIYPTEVGLGQRYHCSTNSGLKLFTREQTFQRAIKTDCPTSVTMGSKPPNDLPTTRLTNDFSTRLYMNDGMIPKYTGYIPQRRYVFGNTYGDETRSLEVCAHNAPNFGSFTRSKTFA